MANMLDYLGWRGDLSFQERKWNDVDNVILAELAYLRMEDLVPGPESRGTVSLGELLSAYRRAGRNETTAVNNPFPLLQAAGESARFSSVRVGRFVNKISLESTKQFSAVTFYLPDGSMYVSFRGTDNTIVGWREDFNFCFTETPGQTEAADYLNSAAKDASGLLRVGGHSKGGNLAVYAAAFCDAAVQSRIEKVYSNDGPGFNQAVAESPEYERIVGKVLQIIPEGSVVGILLSNKAERKIVKSSAFGIMQHDPFTWQVFGTAFEEADGQSYPSLFMDQAVSQWIKGLSLSQKKNLVNTIFDSMEATGAATLKEMNARKWDAASAILKAVMETDPAKLQDVFSSFKKLGITGRDLLLQDAKVAVDQWAARFRQSRLSAVKEKDTGEENSDG